MEIALLPKQSLRIKGKHATFVINPQDKASCDAVILLGKSFGETTIGEESVVIRGPGEYEIGGVKMTGTRVDNEVIYSLTVDGVEILLGTIPSLDKLQHKLKEHHIATVLCNSSGNVSFVTTLASNVIIFYGDEASAVSQSFGQETVKTFSKYQVTADKLPPEVETILLQ